MKKEELAKRLNGIQYPVRLSEEFFNEIKDSGLVVVYGSSDDLINFEGAIYEQLDAYEGGKFFVHADAGVFSDYKYLEDNKLKEFLKIKNKAKEIEAIWGENKISFQYNTEIPHVKFDVIDDGNIYCKGIIFDINVLRQLDIINNLKGF